MESQATSFTPTFRNAAVSLVLAGCAAALVTHIAALLNSEFDPVSSPIGTLTQSEKALWFRNGLWLLALAHIGLVWLLSKRGAGRFTFAAQCFLMLDAALIVWLPLHFGSVALTDATMVGVGGPLWLLGGSVGFAMTFVAAALWRSKRSTALFTLTCLLLWSLLAPAFLAIDPNWIGAYQRTVGALLLLWITVLAVSLKRYG